MDLVHICVQCGRDDGACCERHAITVLRVVPALVESGEEERIAVDVREVVQLLYGPDPMAPLKETVDGNDARVPSEGISATVSPRALKSRPPILGSFAQLGTRPHR